MMKKIHIIPILFLLLVSVAIIAKDPADISENFPEGEDKRSAALIVKGNLTNKKPVYLNMETLMAFKPVSFIIKNRWNNKKEKYTGLSFIQLLDHIGINKKAEVVDVIARNDYKASIRISDLRRFEYILSYKQEWGFPLFMESLKSTMAVSRLRALREKEHGLNVIFLSWRF